MALVDLVLIKSARAKPDCPKLVEQFPNILVPVNVKIHEDLMISSDKSNSFCGILFDGLQMHDWRVTTPTPGYKNRYIIISHSLIHFPQHVTKYILLAVIVGTA